MTSVNQKIHAAVDRLQLDLGGKTVLTEAATGAYVVTPLLAALAGARVIAFTQNTRYGSVEDVKKLTLDQLDLAGIDNSLVTIVDKLTPEIIGSVDVITNSGHLRPLDQSKLQHAKQGAVIPLMYEAWEWRNADVDIEQVRNKNLKLGATNERHPDVDVFNYLGDMALKLIFDAGLCPYRNTFVLMCNNDFGPHIAQVLSRVCDSLAVCDRKEHRNRYSDLNIDWIGDFPNFEVPVKYRNAEAIIFTAYPFTDTWIGDEKSPILIEKLMHSFEHPNILRYAGHIDEVKCADKIAFYPGEVKPGHMGILPSAIGFDPIIRLQSGGLKAAELMMKGEEIYNGIQLVEMI
ncbi:MAG: hypothetical protein ACKVOK_13100 [Flavobacteriales bacterium]